MIGAGLSSTLAAIRCSALTGPVVPMNIYWRYATNVSTVFYRSFAADVFKVKIEVERPLPQGTLAQVHRLADADNALTFFRFACQLRVDLRIRMEGQVQGEGAAGRGQSFGA